jgi:hypothetical protein
VHLCDTWNQTTIIFIRINRQQHNMAATAPASTIPPILQGDKLDFYELQDKKTEEVEHLEDNNNGLRHDLPQSKFATIGQAAALRLFWKGRLRSPNGISHSENAIDIEADSHAPVAIMFSFMCSFAATSDGFANSLTGTPVFASSTACQGIDNRRS